MKKNHKKTKADDEKVSSLKSVVIDKNLTLRHPKPLKREVEILAADLMQKAHMELIGLQPPPYRLKISARENQMILEFFNLRDRAIHSYLLSLRPLQRHFKDYQDIVLAHLHQEKYNPHQLEAIDMARRGIHDSAATLLLERLAGKINLSMDTARRVFSLLTLLFIPNVAGLTDFSLLTGGYQHGTMFVDRKFLFCCTMNMVRSPMALFLARHLWQDKLTGGDRWQSAGVMTDSEENDIDPFVSIVLAEKNIPTVARQRTQLDSITDDDMIGYDKVFALSSTAFKKLTERNIPKDKIIYWQDIIDPTLMEGTREQKLFAYRQLYDQLTEKLQAILTEL